MPDAIGVWGAVYSSTWRALRTEMRKRDDLARELELFINAAETIEDGVVILDAADQVMWCNGMAARHLEIKPGADRGLRVTNIVRVPGLAVFLQRARGDETLDYRPAGDAGAVLSLKVLPFGDGRKLLTSLDITQIVRADTTRRDFIANVSHELRTPLTVIHGFLEHMNEAPVRPGEAPRRHIELMAQQSDRMLKLVDDLLMLSRLEGGDSPPREEHVDLPVLLHALAEDARALSAGRHTVTVEAPPGCVVKGALEELRSAFGNLVSNAVRYTPSGGTIRLAWQVNADGQGEFVVADTGIGIAAEHIPRLTERFYRVDRGRSRETGGTGLGLAIVKHVLLRHQAALDIQSELGKGSEFRVRFPSWRCLVEPIASLAEGT
jgi:two-component system phosphate regulon sensor histidine kinase PhoR